MGLLEAIFGIRTACAIVELENGEEYKVKLKYSSFNVKSSEIKLALYHKCNCQFDSPVIDMRNFSLG